MPCILRAPVMSWRTGRFEFAGAAELNHDAPWPELHRSAGWRQPSYHRLLVLLLPFRPGGGQDVPAQGGGKNADC